MEKLIQNLSIYSPLLGLVFIYKFQKMSSTDRLVLLFIFTSFLSDLIIGYLNSIKFWEINNYLAIGLYGAVELLLGTVIFYHLLKKKRVILLIGGIVLLIYLFDIFWWEANRFNTAGKSMESIVFIFFSLYTFWYFYKNEQVLSIEQTPAFWYNSAFLIYFSGAFFSWILFEFFPKTLYLWSLHNFANFLKNMILAVGLWKVRRQ